MNTSSYVVENVLTAALKAHSEANPLFVVAYADNVPQTGRGIAAMYQDAIVGKAPFLVFDGANNASYFGSENNMLYRTMHDIDHAKAYIGGTGGTTKLIDELKLNLKMAKRIYEGALKMGFDQIAINAFWGMFHDACGQVYYYSKNKDFVQDQIKETQRRIDAMSMHWHNHFMVSIVIEYIESMTDFDYRFDI